MVFFKEKKVKNNQQKQITKNWLCILRARPQKGQQRVKRERERRNGHENQNCKELKFCSFIAALFSAWISLNEQTVDNGKVIEKKKKRMAWHAFMALFGIVAENSLIIEFLLLMLPIYLLMLCNCDPMKKKRS